MLKRKKKPGARRRAKKVEQEQDQEQEEKDDEDMDVDGEEEASYVVQLFLTSRMMKRSRRRGRSRHPLLPLRRRWLSTKMMMTTTHRRLSL